MNKLKGKGGRAYLPTKLECAFHSHTPTHTEREREREKEREAGRAGSRHRCM